MKTKYWKIFVYGGILLAMGVGSQIGNPYLKTDPYANLFMVIFAVISVGFGFKLRRMNKNGIQDTKQEKGQQIVF